MESAAESSSFTEYIDLFCVKHAYANWPKLASSLEYHQLSAKLNKAERSITISTTARTSDPDIIDRARECVLLFSKTLIPPTEAIKVLNGELPHEFIMTGFQEVGIAAIHGMKQKQYLKREKRLSSHVKNIGLSLRCHVYVGDYCLVATCVEDDCVKRLRIFREAVKSCIIGVRNAKRLSKKLRELLAEDDGLQADFQRMEI